MTQLSPYRELTKRTTGGPSSPYKTALSSDATCKFRRFPKPCSCFTDILEGLTELPQSSHARGYYLLQGKVTG